VVLDHEVTVLNVSEAGIVAAPTALVEAALLAELPRIARLLPNVDAIEPLASHWSGGVLQRRDRWIGRSTSSVLRALTPGSAVTWTIRSRWEMAPSPRTAPRGGAPFRIVWALEPTTGIVDVEGSGSIVLEPSTPSHTRVSIEARLRFGDGLGMLAALGRSRVERVASELLRANVQALLQGAAELVADVTRTSHIAAAS
jgi:hypothetical protein